MDDLSFVGSVAGVLSSGAFIPQAVKTIKDKKTESISLFSYLIFILSLLTWLAYGIVRNDYAVMFTNIITLIPAVIIFYVKIKYK
jgi:MtN3 and saliva related transmembrane protein